MRSEEDGETPVESITADGERIRVDDDVVDDGYLDPSVDPMVDDGYISEEVSNASLVSRSSHSSDSTTASKYGALYSGFVTVTQMYGWDFHHFGIPLFSTPKW